MLVANKNAAVLMIWFNKPHDITTFTPAWMFMVFPVRFTLCTAHSCTLKICLDHAYGRRRIPNFERFPGRR